MPKEGDPSKERSRNQIAHGLIALSLAFEIASIFSAFDSRALKERGKTVWIANVPAEEMRYRLDLANIEKEKEIEKDQQLAILFMAVALIAGGAAMVVDYEPKPQDSQDIWE